MDINFLRERSMEPLTQILPVKINDQVTVMVEAKAVGGEQDVSNQILYLQDLTDAIEGITRALASSINKVKPDRATVELGLQVTVKSGRLTALLVEGTGKGNLKISLQWGQ